MKKIVYAGYFRSSVAFKTYPGIGLAHATAIVNHL
jgi:DNA uptake protein ComE-like DNA-binding protein